MQLPIFGSIQPLKLRSSMHPTEPSLNKQYRLIASLQRKIIYKSTSF